MNTKELQHVSNPTLIFAYSQFIPKFPQINAPNIMQLRSNANKNIQETSLSSELKEQSKKMGITTLRDFMALDLQRLREHPAFSQIWYTEMLRQLSLAGLLDEFQGTIDK